MRLVISTTLLTTLLFPVDASSVEQMPDGNELARAITQLGSLQTQAMQMQAMQTQAMQMAQLQAALTHGLNGGERFSRLPSAAAALPELLANINRGPQAQTAQASRVAPWPMPSMPSGPIAPPVHRASPPQLPVVVSEYAPSSGSTLLDSNGFRGAAAESGQTGVWISEMTLPAYSHGR